MADKRTTQKQTIHEIEKACPTQWKTKTAGRTAVMISTGAKYPDGSPVNVYITPAEHNHRYVASDRGEALTHANSAAGRARIQPPHMVLHPLSLTMRYGAIIGGITDEEEIPAICTRITQAAIRIAQANQA